MRIGNSMYFTVVPCPFFPFSLQFVFKTIYLLFLQLIECLKPIKRRKDNYFFVPSLIALPSKPGHFPIRRRSNGQFRVHRMESFPGERTRTTPTKKKGPITKLILSHGCLWRYCNCLKTEWQIIRARYKNAQLKQS